MIVYGSTNVAGFKGASRYLVSGIMVGIVTVTSVAPVVTARFFPVDGILTLSEAVLGRLQLDEGGVDGILNEPDVLGRLEG